MNSNTQPLVSVIITTFRNEAYLPRAIESVLHQDYPNIELIVVDDNPPDSPSRANTIRVMQQYPTVKYICHPENRNGAAARNTGIAAASGTYIAFLDNDDFYFSAHIRHCVQALSNHPEHKCVLCGVMKIHDGICWDIISPPHGDWKKMLFFKETALGTGSNLFIDAAIVHQLHGFDEHFLRHQDVEFGLRLFAVCSACCIPDVQIIKEMDGFSNAPNFDRFLQTKQLLWKTFASELSQLTLDEQKRYFAGQYRSLLYTACKSGKKSSITWTVQQLRQYDALEKKDRILLMLSRLHLFPLYEGLKQTVKQHRSPHLYAQTVNHLCDYDRNQLNHALHKTNGEE